MSPLLHFRAACASHALSPEAAPRCPPTAPRGAEHRVRAKNAAMGRCLPRGLSSGEEIGVSRLYDSSRVPVLEGAWVKDGHRDEAVCPRAQECFLGKTLS